eukprot:Blabericola_migrator_1__7639@NODE_38_length_17790_cov_195_231733_g34_i0_p5_GENE_NODE_38_length_17790_cov_195_231733_g34_i0NODE_38_length_17790_cov_195_231733_g34_i0_p5_ORF_typecomplete_len420_score77_99ANAPC4_WD40/PF12894_7/6_7ANAPC4_WD40/PF12894_7/5_8e07ANAPC4_WD40/PF12894_7/16WD40_4/PF16300_5/5_3e08WD40/PF00400_32/0_99WD40/PF00400_32/0_0097Ge1_WD40/PF16529_5/0_018Ge1_WD40/PF16529_5/0_97eIF2A/PF08662_11/0_0014DUF1899/PF08953_11/0_0034WD40_like/PF17005_5/0_13_NODE_38_length_17790_cov_195_231733_
MSKASIFRNIFAIPSKEAFREVPIAKDNDMGRALSVSSDHVAFTTAPRGMVAVVAHDQLGNKSAANSRALLHPTGVVDMEHSPFCSRILASGGEDGSLKISCVRGGGAEIRIDSIAQLQEKKDKKMMSVNWHPVAENVLASASMDGIVHIWDLDAGTDTISGSIKCYPWMIQWDQTGSNLALVDQDRLLKIIDPRSGLDPVLTSSEPFVKSNKVCRFQWLEPYDGSQGGLAALGFENMGEKWLKLFDPRSLSAPLQALKLPGKSSGLPFLHFDQTSSLLFVTARGEASCHLAEWSEQQLSLLPDQKFSKQASNCAFLPRRACSVAKNEIARTYRTEFEAKTISVASFVVNRRSGDFAEDLHTMCATGEPALTAQDWFNGCNESPVIAQMHSVEDGELQFPDREPENTEVLCFDEGGDIE